MKLLTLKDFIIYNNPCFSCQDITSLRFICKKNDNPMSEHPMTSAAGRGVIAHPVVTSKVVDMDLKVNYADGVLNLRILHQSNKIISDIDALTNYLSEHTLYVMSKCVRCSTYVRSNDMIFDLDKKILKPLSIFREFLLIEEGEKMYSLTSNFLTQESVLVSGRILHPSVKTDQFRDPIELRMPLQPLSKFKNKEAFIKKMKTLLLFS